MRLCDVTRFGTLLSAGVLVVSCGAPQREAVLPGAGPPAQAPGASGVAPASHGVSRMARGVKQRDLLYVSNANGTVSVYRYWQHNLVGVLTDFTQPLGECANAAGDVYIADGGAKRIFEYAHGGTKPIAKINDSPNEPYDCSVDDKTGDLAVANFNKGYNTAGTVAVYPHGSGTPIVYQASGDDHFVYSAYDDHGDLLVVSRYYYYYYFYSYYNFYYLPKNGTKLLSMYLMNPFSSTSWRSIQGIAWDGQHWVVESYGDLVRYDINIKAKFVDSITLTGGYGYPHLLAMYRKNSKSLASQVVAGEGSESKNQVDYWHYPAGGDPLYSITKDLDAPYGVAISLRTR